MPEIGLIGRDREVQILTDALGAARSRSGGMVVVAGEAGIGKSRLLDEVSARAASDGLLVLRGRTGSGPASVPFRPIAEALAGGLRSYAVGQVTLRGFEPALGHLLPGWFPGTGTAAAPDLVFVAEAVLRLLRVMAGSRGVLLALEDIHAADPESVELVSYLADNVGSERALVVVTVRDPPSTPAVEALHVVARRGGPTWLRLGRMDDADLQRLAAERLGRPVPPEAWRTICSRAEGIPLFVEELITALADRGLAGDDTDEGRRSQLVVPASFRVSVEERLERLGTDGGAVLAAAALLGRQFDTTLLQVAVQRSTGEVARVLTAAVSSGLLEAAPGPVPGWMRFRHELTRDAVLDLAAAPVQRDLAEAVLDAVRAAHPGLTGGWCEIAADLAVVARRSDEAVVLLRRVAERARGQGALGLARATLERAIALDCQPEQHELASLELLDVLVASGHHDRADLLGAQLLRDVGSDGDRAGRLHLALAELAMMRLRLDLADRHLEAASGADGEARQHRGLLRAQLELGRYRYAESERIARGVAEEATREGLTGIACEALLAAGRATAATDIAEAEVTFTQALHLAEARGRPVQRAAALAALAGLDVLRVASDERVRLAREAALGCGMTALVASLSHDLGMLALLHHDLEEGRRWAEETVAEGRRYRLGWVLAAGLVKHAFAAALMGDSAGAQRLLGEAAPLAAGDPRGTALMAGHVRVAAAIAAEDLPAATEAAAEAALLWWDHHLEPRPYLGLWALLQAVGVPHRLPDVIDRLEQRSALWQPTVRGLVLAGQAVRAAAEGEGDEAAALVAEALPLLERTPWFSAVACRYAGERLLSMGVPGGAEHLRTALSFFAAAGLEAPAGACRALLRSAGYRVPRRRRASASMPAPLAAAGVSARELEVLLLVAEGLSSREIGGRLYLSARTVDHHVQSLLLKTGTRNRAALAGRLAEWGLAGSAEAARATAGR